MKFTLSWLKEHLDTNVEIDLILETLTDLGLEVEEVHNPLDKLRAFTVGKILTAEKHPNADKLKVCEVETGLGVKNIICGANNARAGIKVVVAHPGDYVPGIDTKIKIGKIRGVESQGMLCSELEMTLSGEHDGIIELPKISNVGEKAVKYLKKLEVVIDIAITPNRPDALGVEGIARDLAARGLGKFVPKKRVTVPGTFASPIKVKIEPDLLREGCPLFIGRYIRGIQNCESPNWLKDRLTSIGVKPISALVDITNFITFDRARPLHVFDADTLSEELIIRKARGGESFQALDNKEYHCAETDTVISSGTNVVSLAGIIGGVKSSVKINTTNVYLESAYFSPIQTARTGRRLKVISDARYRFERGIDPAFTEPGIELATRMILDICGGSASKLEIDGNLPDTTDLISFDPGRVESLAGMHIPRDQQKKTLRALGFSVTDSDYLFKVVVPSWRPDIFGEADIVEEIVRVASLSKLEGIPLKTREEGVKKPIISKEFKRNSNLRRLVASIGFDECISYSFIGARSAEFFLRERLVKLANPISVDMNVMRPSILPGLLKAVAKNHSRENSNLGLFEIGDIFTGSMPNQQATELAAVLVGENCDRNLHLASRPVDVYDAKAKLECCLQSVNISIDSLRIEREKIPSYMHPGKSGLLWQGPKNLIASFGELHPKIVQDYGIKRSVVFFEIFLRNIPFPKKRKVSKGALLVSDLQHVDRDFALVIPSDFEVGKLVSAIKKIDTDIISDAFIFDVFEGSKAQEQFGIDKKSVAFSVRLQPKVKTFVDTEIENICKTIIDVAIEVSAGQLRL